ncbi:hypothetical protein LTR36_000278 [Oleoguttula mirabilis]|uniref:Uncharacterized protein n=1 Tax=Oleoguttula mirabilis TaxID=1507867 RepID=A0AAV9JYH1_9PEZI|nr:hypothetical protein LTR36_000278 [Oleoguttula mirabilis]
MDPVDLLDLRCLDGHFSSLEWLILDIFEESEDERRQIGAGQEVIDLVAMKSRKLRELGITLHAPGLALSAVKAGKEVTYPPVLESIIRCTELRVLCLGDWPLAPTDLFKCDAPVLQDSVEVDELYKARYFALMDKYATMLLRHITEVRKGAGLPKFAMLCFSSDWVLEEGSDRMLEVTGHCYVSGMEIDVYGQARVRAIRMTKKEVSYVEGDDNLYQRYYQ